MKNTREIKMDAENIAVDANSQGSLDANIRRCGLFGLIPVAVRFLLFASAVPLSKVFGYIDDKAWMQCSRHTDIATGLAELVGWWFFARSSARGAKALYYCLPLAVPQFFLPQIRSYVLGHCTGIAISLAWICALAYIVAKNKCEIRTVAAIVMASRIIGLAVSIYFFVIFFPGTLQASPRTNQLVMIGNVISIAAMLTSTFAYLKMLIPVRTGNSNTESTANVPHTVPLHLRIFVAAAPWLVITSTTISRACAVVLLAPLGIAAVLVGEKHLDNGLWIVPVGWLVYILATTAIVFSRTRRIFAITALIMLALIITNISGCAGMGHL